MNGIEQIRESRKVGYWGSPVDAYECLEAERHVDYLLSEVDRLHELVAKAAKLQAVVDAGNELHKRVVEMFDTEGRDGMLYVMFVHEAKDKYARALAAYEGTG